MDLREIELSKINLPLLIAFSQVEEFTEIQEDLNKTNYDYKNQKTIPLECRTIGTRCLKNSVTGKKVSKVDSKNAIDDSKTAK